MTPDPERLSTTLEAVASELSQPCTAGEIVNKVLARHSDYAGGRAKQIVETAFNPPPSRRQPVRQWYAEARRQLKGDLGTLSGKTVILGLAVADRVTGRELVRCGLFGCVLSQVTEGYSLFSDRGRERLATIPRAALGDAPEPIVLQQAGLGLRGGLAPDGSRAVGYTDRGTTVALWSVENAALIRSLTAAGWVRMARFSADGSRIVAMLGDGSVVRWRTQAIDDAEVVTPAVDGFASGALSTDSRCAVVRLNRPGFAVIDLETGRRAEVPTEGRLTRVSVSADGQWIAVASGRTGGLYQRAGTAVQLVRSFATEQEIRALECGPDLAAVSAGGVLTVHGQREIQLPARDAERVAVNVDGSLLAWVGPDTLTLVQPETAVELATLPSDQVVRATFSLDGRRMLVSHTDNTMRVWDVGLEQPASRPPPATFDSDVADDSRDFLNRSRDVDAFASLIAAKAVQPPLSIGVFGDWGSGKSWFMGQLKRRVDQIAADTRDSNARQSEVSFFKHIAQVQFNAWHYAEADVLSSLVDHVFNRLDLGEGTGDTYQTSLAAAETQLAKAGLAEKKAATELDDAERELADLTESRRAQEEQRASAAVARTAELWTTQTKAKVLLDAEAALKQYGLGELSRTAGDLVAAVRDQRAELRRANLLLAPLVRGEKAERVRHRRRAVLWICIVPVLALVAGAVIGGLDDASVAALAGAGAFLTAVLGGLAKVLVAHTSWIRQGLDQLVEAERTITAAVDAELEPRDKAIHEARRQELAKTDEVAGKRASLATAHQMVEQGRKELDDGARPSRALEDLVDARILSGDYASRLGVVALARHDFEKVSDLIRAVNASIEGPSPGDEAEVKVNRIVLYIDDLDRCEPENVAKVLQAVHLLLAFPLFVVVVGVDPRWVGRALKKQYPDLLDDERGDLRGSGSGPKGVSPNDYLEKIFQIPFWLQPLNDDRTKSMLRGLTGVGAGPDRRRPVRRDGSGTPDGSVTPSDTDSAGRSEGTSPTGPTGGRLAQSQELNPRGLLLESHEVDAMQELSHLLDRSPRALKRFVNVYRLFKVRQPDVVDFADRDRPDADYRVVLYLLAEIIGRPAAAADLFDFIRTADEETVLTTVPPGWPQHAGAYQAWLDEVGRFSFRAMTVDEER